MRSGIYKDGWDILLKEWEEFRTASNIPNAAIPVYLLNCCDASLKDNVHKEKLDISMKGEADVLAAIKVLAVVTVTTCVL